MKKAFTLIELLVVIAIIAILAAILFPVFAQAKAAAKASANLSNLKQVGLGNLQYSADSDDVFPLAALYNQQVTYVGDTAVSNGQIVPWQEAIFPYTKSRDIYTSPLEGSAPGAGRARQIAQSQYYGVVPSQAALRNGGNANIFVNALPVSATTTALVDGPFGFGVGGTNPYSVPSVSQTAIDHLSDVVMVSDAGSFDMGFFGGGYTFAAGATNPAQALMPTIRNTGSFTASAPFTGTVMTGPWARKNVSGTWNGGKVVPNPIVAGNSRGQTQFCATDGSAKSVEISKMYEIRNNGTANVYYRLYGNTTN